MALQHHEFELQLRDAKRLRLYVQSGMAEREIQSASLKEAKLACHLLKLRLRNLLKELLGLRLRGMRHAMRQRLLSWRLKGLLIPEHRWSSSLPGFNVP